MDEARLPGRGITDRYVAIGTSISMGVAGDGVIASSQAVAWPAQFAQLLGKPFAVPAIDPPGCGAPLLGPLASGLRTSGEGAGRADDGTAICAPNSAGVTLPTNNLAIDGARTSDALFSTTSTYAGTLRGGEYARVLPPGYTQVTSMLIQRPRTVTVELGGNELLGARKGVYNSTVVVPTSTWKPLYSLVLGAVSLSAKQVVLVGLVKDAGKFPSFRTGQELWNARATFAPFNVVIGEDCGTTNATNILFVPVRVPVAVGTGVAQARAGAGPYTLSCANAPSSTGIEDYVLTAEEMGLLNAQLAEMNAFIESQASAHRWAYFALEDLYGRSDLKPPFNAVAMMTDPNTPYGPYISLDGIHPNAAGHAILANAAAAAFRARYGLDLTP
ncbi:MAG TPA: SGNH/GDSL hydrolase family protein [Gemmatimonadaceae bacterium]|nr:SGNH/GDSL hydrolase family protein [Gemmatimonadaceae bacterium]